jgi:predicted DNA-binding ribbon-helix-helix protein
MHCRPLDQGRRENLAGLIKRSFSLAGHRTSVALEAAFWAALTEIAGYRGITLSGLVASVDSARDGTTALASALRVLALREAWARVGQVPPARPDP